IAERQRARTDQRGLSDTTNISTLRSRLKGDSVNVFSQETTAEREEESAE
ncbi:MAG: hypothetical protein QOJ08_1106, partial [Ilumatobacteraceae bacterium]